MHIFRQGPSTKAAELRPSIANTPREEISIRILLPPRNSRKDPSKTAGEVRPIVHVFRQEPSTTAGELRPRMVNTPREEIIIRILLPRRNYRQEPSTKAGGIAPHHACISPGAF